ncbi:MAG: transglutaminase domain-containing protein [Bdellovibrionaceae bacterium]|nr:transglutaminase domain-containing protein [Pseudobdellovibrionaceae bacterium]
MKPLQLPFVFALLGLVGSIPTARAQDWPMWQNTEMDLTFPSTEGLTIGNGLTISEGGILPGTEVGGLMATALSVPASVDEEVQKLAQALGEGQAVAGENATAKALRIYNWVRNNIDYEHYHGLVKGTALTLLEGSGNDFDQCALLRDLLVAAGYPAADVKLVRLSSLIGYAELRDWLGFADEPFPGKSHLEVFGFPATDYHSEVSEKVAKQLSYARAFLNNRGSGTVLTSDGFASYLPQSLPGNATLLFDRIMVGLTVNGGADLLYFGSVIQEIHQGSGN